MSKSVLISIQPKWCELIASGKKTAEVRKSKPKLDVPFKVYIYCSKSKSQFLQSRSNMRFYCENKDTLGGHGPGLYIRLNGTVIGEFVCDEIQTIHKDDFSAYGIYDCSDDDVIASCMQEGLLWDYGQGKDLYFWHISNLKIYDKPKELSEFKKINQPCWYGEMKISKRDCHECKSKDCFIQRPPQSWCYVEDMEVVKE